MVCQDSQRKNPTGTSSFAEMGWGSRAHLPDLPLQSSSGLLGSGPSQLTFAADKFGPSPLAWLQEPGGLHHTTPVLCGHMSWGIQGNGFLESLKTGVGVLERGLEKGLP